MDQLHANAPFEQLLDDDLKIEAKKAKKSIEHEAPSGAHKLYPLKATMLSPNLAQRFSHLLARQP